MKNKLIALLCIGLLTCGVGLSQQTVKGGVTIKGGVTLPKASAGSPTASLDIDAGAASGSWAAPTLTPSATGNLLYCVTTVSSGVSTPTAGGTQGIYTGAAGAITNGNMAEYDLSSPNTLTSCDYTSNQSNSTMVASFKWSGGSSTTHIQGAVSASGVPVLGTNPTTGNLIVCGATQNVTTGTLTGVQDGNANAYTISANSPSANQATGSAGQTWIVYLLSAPANADKTITFTWGSGSTAKATWCDEFHRVP